MGYKPQGTIYNLEFIDGEYMGLVVKMRSMTIGRLSRMIGGEWDKLDPAKNLEVFNFVATKIVEWNIEHPEPDDSIDGKCVTCGLKEGMPLPKVGESFLCLDIVLISKILNTWMEAVASLAAPKERSTPNGDAIERALAALPIETMPTPNLSR